MLRSAAEKTYPCIAVENGVINQTNIGDPAPNFIIDAIGDEGRSGQRNIIGPYITKSQDEHAIKCVVYMIRNSEKQVIGCLCIGIDLSMPVNVFFESLMLKVDEGLAEGMRYAIAVATFVVSFIPCVLYDRHARKKELLTYQIMRLF